MNQDSVQYSADLAVCFGAKAPVIADITKDNVVEVRKNFLLNVVNNGNGESYHECIIHVLQYMSQFMD